MRHIGFLVVGSEFALDGKEKNLEIPFLLKPAEEREIHSSSLTLPPEFSPLMCRTDWINFVQRKLHKKLVEENTPSSALVPCCPVSVSESIV